MPPSVTLVIASDVFWLLVRITVSGFLRAHRDRSIVHVERRNADRLRGVEHDADECVGALVEQRHIGHAIAIEVRNRRADDTRACVIELRRGECAIAIALKYGGAELKVARAIGDDYIEVPISV